MKNYLNRIKYTGDLNTLLDTAFSEYDLGKVIEFKVIEIGYEDLNFIVETTKDKYFVKFYAKTGDFRKSLKDCKEYISKITEAIKFGIPHPKLIFNKKMDFLTSINIEKQKYLLSVEEYISHAETQNITDEDIIELGKSVANLHKSQYKPSDYYDCWSIRNFEKEFQEKYKYLEIPDRKVLSSLVLKFQKINWKKLPHSFIHGDIITTNILKSKSNKLYIIDFSVANYGPRILDLAIIGCNIIFDTTNAVTTYENIKLLLKSYSKISPLSEYELQVLPDFIDFAHAMHILEATYEIKSSKEFNDENYYWRDLGRKGLASYYKNFLED